jgi:hypothetical protein
MLVDIFKYIRKLAKTNHYQTVYSVSKEHSLGLFHNTYDYTDLQITFLRYLGFYSSLYLDVSLGDIDDRIFEDEIYEDAYSYYKNKKDNKNEMNSRGNHDFSYRGKEYPNPSNTSQWIFKSKIQ